MSRPVVPVISGVAAAIAAFPVWLVLDHTVAGSIIFAVIAGIVAYGVSYLQNRVRK